MAPSEESNNFFHDMFIFILLIIIITIVVGGGGTLATIGQAFEASSGPLPQDNYALPREVSDHAYERHGNDARTAIDFVASPNAHSCRWNCPDGRIRFVCLDPARGLWAVVVQEGARIVTAFWTQSGNYANNTVVGCRLVP